MNRLKPELQKLVNWARQAPPRFPPTMPEGFDRLVVRDWLAESATDFVALWQTIVWKSAWAAIAVILLGLAMLSAEKRGSPSPYDLSPAYEVVSTQFVP